MRLLPTTPMMIAGVAFLAAACADGMPTSISDASVPNLGHKPGHNPGGGGGGGQPDGDPPIIVTFNDNAGYSVRSDGRGMYVDGECGVMATFNLNDARLDPDAKKIKPNDGVACDGREARSVKVSLTDPTEDSPPHELDDTTVDGVFFKVNEVEDVTVADGTVQTSAVIHGPFGCGLGLRFNPNQDPNSNEVNVTQNADGTWTVTTQAAPDNVAVCLTDDPATYRYYHLPFQVTVTLK